jgi:hypothetical protein
MLCIDFNPCQEQQFILVFTTILLWMESVGSLSKRLKGWSERRWIACLLQRFLRFPLVLAIPSWRVTCLMILAMAQWSSSSVATLSWPRVGVKPNTWKELGFGVLRDSRMFRARQQGVKHLALGCYWCHWKGLET